MSETSLTKEFRDVTSAANSRIRDLVMQVSDKSLRDKLVQRYNLAIGDVSKARRNTNR